MTKKTKIILIISAIAAVLAIAVAGVLVWFFSPGIHVLFGHIHLEVSETGCIMNENGEVLGEATFAADGFAQNSKTVSDGEFTLSLTGFPAITEEDTRGALAYEESDGVWTVTVSKPSFTTDPETGKPVFERAAKYEIYIDKNSGDILTCCVYGVKDKEGIFYFVPAEHQSDPSDYIGQVLQRIYG